jgi:hypothetical protein
MKKAWDDFWNNVPQIMNRSETMTRDIAAVSRDRMAIEKATNRTGVLEKTMAHIKFMDKMTVRSGATATYLANGGALNVLDEKAMAETLRVVRMTQPTGDVKDLASLQRGGAFEKLATMFMNQPNKYYNLIYASTRAYSKGRIGKGQLARTLFYAWIVPSIVFEWMTTAGKADTEDYLTASVLGPARYALLVGNLIEAARTGFDYEFSPIASVGNDIKSSAGKLMQGEILEGMWKLAEVTAETKGIPVNQPKRSLEGLYDMVMGKTDDWRRLIWSKYTLKDTDKEDIISKYEKKYKSKKTDDIIKKYEDKYKIK